LRGKIKDVQDSMSELRFANNAQPQQEKPPASGDHAQQAGGLTAHELAQVQKVLENMERWEKTRKALPEIVERLRTLAPLHEASASFVEQLDEVENKQGATQKMMDDLQLIVVRLEQSLALNSKRLADNMQSLESRIARLEKLLTTNKSVKNEALDININSNEEVNRNESKSIFKWGFSFQYQILNRTIDDRSNDTSS